MRNDGSEEKEKRREEKKREERRRKEKRSEVKRREEKRKEEKRTGEKKRELMCPEGTVHVINCICTYICTVLCTYSIIYLTHFDYTHFLLRTIFILQFYFDSFLLLLRLFFLSAFSRFHLLNHLNKFHYFAFLYLFLRYSCWIYLSVCLSVRVFAYPSVSVVCVLLVNFFSFFIFTFIFPFLSTFSFHSPS